MQKSKGNHLTDVSKYLAWLVFVVLKLFVHVSTAFAHYREAVVEEKIYDFPVDPANILESLPWTDEEALNRIATE